LKRTGTIRTLVSNKYFWCGIILLAIFVIGTLGYWIIGGGDYSLFDCLYMTIITITTIGFTEIIDLAGNTAGRVFTVIVAICGIGVLAYLVTNITAAIVEGQLTKSFRRRRMEKAAAKAREHYIICGMGEAGRHIINELRETRRPHVIVDVDPDRIDKSYETMSDGIFIEGDATDNDTLTKAGIESASGVFAVTGDDNQNLVICLTAKQLNPRVRVVAQCNEMKNTVKMVKAGADSVVSPGYISGMRMASEMIRPTVVNFLDNMLRGRDESLRVEEVPMSPSFVGKALADLDLKKYPRTLLLAVKKGENWVYNPSRNEYIIEPENRLIVMTTPEERRTLEKNVRE
jgi:voltage-gated potassium channel